MCVAFALLRSHLIPFLFLFIFIDAGGGGGGSGNGGILLHPINVYIIDVFRRTRYLDSTFIDRSHLNFKCKSLRFQIRFRFLS